MSVLKVASDHMSPDAVVFFFCFFFIIYVFKSDAVEWWPAWFCCSTMSNIEYKTLLCSFNPLHISRAVLTGIMGCWTQVTASEGKHCWVTDLVFNGSSTGLIVLLVSTCWPHLRCAVEGTSASETVGSRFILKSLGFFFLSLFFLVLEKHQDVTWKLTRFRLERQSLILS